MTIDTQRLAEDPDYWRECGAPEDATHFNTYNNMFYKSGADTVLVFRGRTGWAESDHSVKAFENHRALIPRPKTASEEWADGLPEIGEKREYYNDKMNEIRGCEVIAHRHGCAIVEDQDGVTYEAVPPNEFIRAKQERQRDELIAALKEFDRQRSVAWREDAANFILSRYNLEPKP